MGKQKAAPLKKGEQLPLASVSATVSKPQHKQRVGPRTVRLMRLGLQPIRNYAHRVFLLLTRAKRMTRSKRRAKWQAVNKAAEKFGLPNVMANQRGAKYNG